jgi:hypothetical protein
VADSVLFSGVKSTGTVNLEMFGNTLAVAGEASIAEYRIENWRQNLGNLAAAFREGGADEAFFREMYHGYCGSWSGRNYHAGSRFPGDGEAVNFDGAVVNFEVGEMGSLEPWGSPDGGETAGRTLSFFINDYQVTATASFGETATVALDRIEVRGLLLPSPAGMAALVPLFGDILRHASSPPDALAEKLLAVLRGEYSGHSPYSSILLQGMSFAAPGEDPVRLEELRHSLSLGSPFALELACKGLTVPPYRDTPGIAKILRAFAPEGLLLDGSVAVSLSPGKQGPSRLETSGGVRGLGTGRVSLGFLLDVDDLGDLLENDFDPDRDVLVKDLSMDYADSGFLCMVLALMGDIYGDGAERMYQDLLSVIEDMETSMGPLGKPLAVMLDRPGTFALSGEFGEGVPLFEMSMRMISPNGLSFAVSAEPGPKGLLEYLPESLKENHSNRR